MTKYRNPLNAVACIRCSTDLQTNAPEVQLKAMQDWAAANDVHIVAIFREIGVSGGAPFDKRPILQAALEALRTHNAGVLLFHERTRISRDATTTTLLSMAVKRAGARLVTADGNSATTPEGQLVAGILDHVAQFERALISGRIKRTLAAKKARGERTGGIPYGMALAEDGKTLVPDPREQAILSRIKAMRAEGKSYLAITEALEKDRILNRAGKVAWHKTTIVRLLAAEKPA